MTSPQQRNSFLCPDCQRLISRNTTTCPYCGLNNPGSFWKDNIFTRNNDGAGILKIILIANVVMFVLSLLIDPRGLAFRGSPFNFLSPTSPALQALGSTGSVPLFYNKAWWTLITANYLHGSLMHIVFNMIALHQLGPLLIKEYGTSRFISIYTLSGIGGFLISALFGVAFTIGASAAVCGLIGAALYYGKSRGGAYGNAVYSQLSGWAIGIFIFGFMVPGINNWGHGGGMAVGALCGLLLGYQERKKENMSHKFISMACIICTGLVLLYSTLRIAVYLLLGG